MQYFLRNRAINFFAMPKNAVFVGSLLGFAKQSDIAILDSHLILANVTDVLFF